MGRKKTRKQIIDILEYNMAMLTCDMSISRDPEHQDVSPDYYGKDAEDLYYACEYCLELLKNSIPIKWINRYIDSTLDEDNSQMIGFRAAIIKEMVKRWEKENE